MARIFWWFGVRGLEQPQLFRQQSKCFSVVQILNMVFHNYQDLLSKAKVLKDQIYSFMNLGLIIDLELIQLQVENILMIRLKYCKNVNL